MTRQEILSITACIIGIPAFIYLIALDHRIALAMFFILFGNNLSLRSLK